LFTAREYDVFRNRAGNGRVDSGHFILNTETGTKMIGNGICRLLLPSLFFFGAVGLQAASFIFNTIPGIDNCSGETCSGQAVFSFAGGADTFTVTLSNTLPSIHDAGQLLTDLQFDTAGLGTVSLLSSSGNLIKINSNGTATPATGSIGWGFGSTGTDAWLLCAVCGDGVQAAAQPTQGIVPNQASYSSSVGSIKGNRGHNPFLESGATFTFEAAKLLPTDGSNPFSQITLSFSTAFGVDVRTVLYTNRDSVPGTSTPEPVTTMLAGAGLIVLGLVGRRRLRSQAFFR
jgi:hypothetical protein